MNDKKKFYITTAIAYASAKPHLGNTYEIIMADAIARHKRLRGFDVLFQTGTDEHGQKIEGKANEQGVTPQEYVDLMTSTIKNVWDSVNTSYNQFVRTTDPEHKNKISKIFEKLYKKGDIYKGEYEGLYCTPCESFFTESQLIENNCPDCGRPVEAAKEEAYFLAMSKYQDRLIKLYEENPRFNDPECRKNEIINNFIKPGVQDLCVSRTSFKWGVPVTFDDKHIVYVWIDALSNYITFIGYDPDGSTEEFDKWWPAELQIVGKDINRFHAIYWPVILMALDLPLPKRIFAHPWLLFGDGKDKMSKSKGNIVYADDLANEYGVDAVRYYALHEMPFASDGTYTEELFIERTNSDLANVLGNLVNRTIAMGQKYFGGKIRNKRINTDFDNDLIKITIDVADKIDSAIDEVRLVEALDEVFEIFRRSNKYIDETTPWILAKDEQEKEKLETVIYNLLEAIRIGAIHLSPFLPETSEKIFKQLNTNKISFETIQNFGEVEEYNLTEPTPLFIRIDKDEKLKSKDA